MITVTVCVAVTCPFWLVAVSVYVVVSCGETDCDPLALTGPRPEMVTVWAFSTFHVKVELWPRLMVVGFAVNVTIRGALPCVTDTVTWQVTDAGVGAPLGCGR